MMKRINKEENKTYLGLQKIAKRASLIFTEDDKNILIKSRFKIGYKNNLGIIILIAVCLSFLYFFFRDPDIVSVIPGIILASLFLLIAILAIIAKATDYVLITNQKLEFRKYLIKHHFKLNHRFKVKMASSIEKSESKNSAFAPEYRSINLYLIIDKKEYLFLSYSLMEKYARDANFFGSEVIRKVKQKINNCNPITH